MNTFHEPKSTTTLPPPPCAECGSVNTTVRTETDQFEYRDGGQLVNLTADVNVYHCSQCGFEFTDSTAEDSRHNAVCSYLGVMNPRELKAVRKFYGFSRAQMSSVTKIGEASLARWESGAIIQNKAYDNYLYLLRYPENLSRLQERITGLKEIDSRRQKQTWKALHVTQHTLKDQSSFKLHPIAA